MSRPRWAVLGEKLLEGVIRLSGVSAIFFVLAIFFFVFREAAPVLVSEGFQPRPVPLQHRVVPDLGDERALRHARPHRRDGQRHRPRHGRSRCRSASGPRSTSPSSAAPGSRETLKIVIELLSAIPSVVWGFIGLTVMSELITAVHRRAGGGERPERRDHPRPDERADHRLDRRGRAQGGARLLPRGGRGPRGHPLAAGLPGAPPGRPQRAAGRGAARRGPGGRGDDGGAHGHRPRRPHPRRAPRLGADADRQHRGRARRGPGGVRPLPGAVPHRGRCSSRSPSSST